MAMTLTLVRLDDSSASTDALDLTASGITLAKNGYNPGVAADGDTSVAETITLAISASSVDAFSAKVQSLDKKIKQVGWWSEYPEVEPYQVWLRVKLNNETSERQAMITRIKPPDSLPLTNHTFFKNTLLGNYTFGIERTPYWEDTVATNGSTATLTGNIGGSALWGDTVYGDVPARLSEFKITANTDSGGLSKAWFGFHSSRYGTTPANLAAYWPAACAHATWFDADTSLSNDGNGRGTLTTTFATSASLTRRWHLTPTYYTTNRSDQRGAFLVLLAAMVDTGTVARARIAYSQDLSTTVTSPIYRSRVVINGIGWNTYEMGNVTLPARYQRSTDALDVWAITLEVERVSGTGKFYTYGFWFIPLEGMISISCAMTNPVTVFQRPDGNLVGRAYSSTVYPSSEALIQDINWSLPANDEKPYLIGAVNAGYGGAGNTTIDVAYKYFKRWRTLRGNE